MSKNIEPFLKEFLDIRNECKLYKISESQVFRKLAILDSKYKNNPEYIINIDGLICDLGADCDYKNIIKNSICRLKEKREKYKTSKINYYLGNCIYVLAELENGSQPTIKTLLDDKSYNQARNYFRQIDANSNVLDYSCALTNSANILDKYGRNYEAIYLYDKVLKVNPTFGMALANKAKALEYYIHLSPYKSFKIMRYVIELYSKALLDNTLSNIGGDNASIFFENRINEISRYLEENQQIKTKYEIKTPKSLTKYLNFCLKYNLFLNYDFGHYYDKHSIKDNFFPNFIENIIEPKSPNGVMSNRIYFCFQVFNQILESYTTARLKFFESTTKKYQNIDSLVSYSYSYDYTCHSYKYGLLKSVFCELYNCLDKIAHLIFYYYLDVDPNTGSKDIYFNSLLNEEFKSLIIAKDNYQLLALRSLALDFDTDQQYYYLNKIRNRITHSFLNIKNSMFDNNDILDYQITEDVLINAVSDLFMILKSAIMYSVIAISSDSNNGKYLSMIITKEKDIFY